MIDRLTSALEVLAVLALVAAAVAWAVPLGLPVALVVLAVGLLLASVAITAMDSHGRNRGR